MAQAISTTQNQNVQLLKTFAIAFFAMLVAVPIVTVITASVVKAQFGNVAYAQAAQQSNTLGAGPSCVVPAEEAAKSAATGEAKKAGVFSVSRWFPVSQSNYNSTSTTTSTTTNTDNSKVISKNNGNTSVDNRWSGNTLGLNLTDNRNSGNTYNTDNSNVSNNGNTAVVNSGNTSSSSATSTTTTNTTNNNVNTNTNVNSGNVINNDNDLVDVL